MKLNVYVAMCFLMSFFDMCACVSELVSDVVYLCVGVSVFCASVKSASLSCGVFGLTKNYFAYLPQQTLFLRKELPALHKVPQAPHTHALKTIAENGW